MDRNGIIPPEGPREPEDGPDPAAWYPETEPDPHDEDDDAEDPTGDA